MEMVEEEQGRLYFSYSCMIILPELRAANTPPQTIAHSCMAGRAATPRAEASYRPKNRAMGTSQPPVISAWHSVVVYGETSTSSIVFDPSFPTTFTE